MDGPRNDAFRYEEKDLKDVFAKGLSNHLNEFVLCEDEQCLVKVYLVKVYGEAFLTTSTKAARPSKGDEEDRSKLIFNVSLDVHWYGRCFLGDSTIGSASGKVKIGDVSNETWEHARTWTTEVKLESECLPVALGAPAEEPSEVETLLRKRTEDHLDQLLQRVRELMEIFVKTKRDFANIQHPTRSEPGDVDLKQRFILEEKYRRELCNNKEFLRVLDGVANEEDTWNLSHSYIMDPDIEKLGRRIQENEELRHLILRFNEIRDDGIAMLCDALKGHENLESLDVSHNPFGNAGIQALCSILANGNLPKLQTLKLEKLQEADPVAKTLISALQLFRKQLNIKI